MIRLLIKREIDVRYASLKETGLRHLHSGQALYTFRRKVFREKEYTLQSGPRKETSPVTLPFNPYTTEALQCLAAHPGHSNTRGVFPPPFSDEIYRLFTFLADGWSIVGEPATTGPYLLTSHRLHDGQQQVASIMLTIQWSYDPPTTQLHYRQGRSFPCAEIADYKVQLTTAGEAARESLANYNRTKPVKRPAPSHESLQGGGKRREGQASAVPPAASSAMSVSSSLQSPQGSSFDAQAAIARLSDQLGSLAERVEGIEPGAPPEAAEGGRRRRKRAGGRKQCDEYIQPECMGSSKDRTGNIVALWDMLKRRVNMNVDGGAYQISSPAYVGCSHAVLKRMVTHNAEFSNLKSSSNVLKLLVACIRYIGLTPIVHTIPICMVWEEAQIPLSEMLATVLAQSLISDNGLNVIQPGTNASSKNANQAVNERMKQHIWVRRSLSGVIPTGYETVGQRAQYHMDIIEAAWEEFKTQKSDDQLRQLVRNNDELEGELFSLRNQIKKAIDDRNRRNRKLEEAIKEADEFLALSKGMFPNLSDGDDDDGSHG
ncbi:hypothetical protein F5Y05DRAFT_416840 [Hypoxylon sp. FL0543]|nr:hypothetical protein F5Y05DRAFT_416840 [Hypoxylon sp. FL0543]